MEESSTFPDSECSYRTSNSSTVYKAGEAVSEVVAPAVQQVTWI